MATRLIPVIEDTREQRPVVLDPTVFSVERAKLPAGDYSLKGYELLVCVERKSLGDAVGTLIGDWLRFRKSLYRMAGFDLAVIAVEANIEDVLAHRYESDASPMSVLGKAHACLIDHGVPVLWWGNRTNYTVMLESFLKQAWAKLGGES